ncbi:hypothetical protein Tco_1468489 [Tanacetum coccineum]
MPYRIYETLGREDMKKIDRGITMINHTQAEAMGKLIDVLCQVGVTTIIAKFLILGIPIDHDAPIVVGRGFLYTIGSILNTPERLFSAFDGVCHQTFRAVRFDVLRTAESDSDDEEEYTSGTHDDEAGSSRNKCSKQHETVEELLLPQVHHEYLLWEEIDEMLRIKVCEAESSEEIFTSVAWIRAFNINEEIYAELCHEFYSTYEFDEVCASDELQTKKIIKFRLGGRAHSLTLLEFVRRLEMYQVAKLDEDGFNVYFEGGLRSDEHFNAQEYWLSISREENLGLYQNGYANVAWLIARWMKRKGAGTQRESQICCEQFITKLARKSRVLTDYVIRSLSAPIYYRDLDTATLRELIDSEGRLIPEDP